MGKVVTERRHLSVRIACAIHTSPIPFAELSPLTNAEIFAVDRGGIRRAISVIYKTAAQVLPVLIAVLEPVANWIRQIHKFLDEIQHHCGIRKEPLVMQHKVVAELR